jgi:hypothetical protein
VKQIKKCRRGEKTKITAAVIAYAAVANKSDHRQTIRHIPLIHEVILKTSITQ